MRILILESVSGLHQGIDSRLLPEGFAILRTMVREFSGAGFDVITILNEKLKKFAEWLDADVLFGRNGLSKAIRSKPDAALIISPEKKGELEQITAKLKKKGIEVLGAKKESIRISGDKWLTYSALKGKVPQPKTWRTPPNVERQILVKPVNGVGCEDIRFFSPLSRASEMIFQEFVEGEHASCCMLMREEGGAVLSVNKQYVVIRNGRFRYFGNEIPLKHNSVSAEECAEIALKAARNLNLHGFCGVDLVVGKRPYFIELNPRVTTSFVALAQVLQANLGEILINVLVDGASMPKHRLKGCSIVRIPRARDNVKITTKKLNKLQEIPKIIAPPFPQNGNLNKGSPIFVVVGSGSTLNIARSKLNNILNEATALVGIDRDAIAWS